MNREQRRSFVKRQKEHLKSLNLPAVLTQMPKDQWPGIVDEKRIQVYISQKYMVQVFLEEKGIIRLSINRTAANGKSWDENITWEDLQIIKNQVGFSDFDAVEVFPKFKDVVNVANMRHLFVMPEPLEFAWRKVK